MTDFAIILTTGAVVLMALGIVSATLLRGWTLWIDLRHSQLATLGAPANAMPSAQDTDDTRYAGNRIELADLRERVRKLEAIAAGVDL